MHSPAELHEAPIFILGCSWRCGSTLLQRLLCSVEELMVWGENMAISSLMLEMCTRLRSREKASSSERAQFRRAGDAWIANMSPEVANAEALCRDWLLGFYLPATRKLGKLRWGFKEVRHDATIADFLTKLFPHGKVILLVRNPVDVLASLRSRAWYRTATAGPAAAVDSWCRNVASFLEAQERHVLVRYEDLITDGRKMLSGLETRLALRQGAIDPKPLDLVLRGWEATPPRLGAPEILALRRKHVFELAQRCGYRLEADPRLFSRSLMTAMFSRGADAR